MNRYFRISLISASILTIHSSQASDRMSLDQLLEEKNPEQVLTDLKTKYPQNFESICAEIKKDEDGFRAKAQNKNFGALKQARIISSCTSGFGEQAKIGAITQKPKQAEAQKEEVKLKPLAIVEFGKKTDNIQEEQKTLQAAKMTILENAALLGKKQEIEAKLIAVEKELKNAQGFYDNLSAAVLGIRDDLDTFTRFHYFNPKEHRNDTPEKYLETLDVALLKGDRLVLPKDYEEQLKAANNLLKQANENLANARKDLEQINREMLQLTK